MYLSRLVLNDRERRVYQDLANAHKLHQRIMQGFPDVKEDIATPRQDWHILYRQEPESDSLIILVQSTIAPDWERLPGGYLTAVRVKSFDWSPQVLKPGNLYQFRLQANPSKRDSKTRKIIGFYQQEEQLNWLLNRSESWGFRCLDVDPVPLPNTYGKKRNQSGKISIHAVLFQGTLQVIDSDKLISALTTGIGRGKSYGCGLLSIAKV
ncbi:MAG: type I-E CRISPR-associated protein Cas6/Cse3/CasE [Cyanobacteriota bacterium]|jgi:CRISPR system Cascade subunit CasE